MTRAGFVLAVLGSVLAVCANALGLRRARTGEEWLELAGDLGFERFGSATYALNAPPKYLRASGPALAAGVAQGWATWGPARNPNNDVGTGLEFHVANMTANYRIVHRMGTHDTYILERVGPYRYVPHTSFANMLRERDELHITPRMLL